MQSQKVKKGIGQQECAVNCQLIPETEGKLVKIPTWLHSATRVLKLEFLSVSKFVGNLTLNLPALRQP